MRVEERGFRGGDAAPQLRGGLAVDEDPADAFLVEAAHVPIHGPAGGRREVPQLLDGDARLGADADEDALPPPHGVDAAELSTPAGRCDLDDRPVGQQHQGVDVAPELDAAAAADELEAAEADRVPEAAAELLD